MKQSTNLLQKVAMLKKLKQTKNHRINMNRQNFFLIPHFLCVFVAFKQKKKRLTFPK